MKIKILYAEDDEFTRKFEIRRLKECGFNVSSVEDGQEAFTRFGGLNPGTTVLCTVLKKATEKWKVLVSIDSIENVAIA